LEDVECQTFGSGMAALLERERRGSRHRACSRTCSIYLPLCSRALLLLALLLLVMLQVSNASAVAAQAQRPDQPSRAALSRVRSRCSRKSGARARCWPRDDSMAQGLALDSLPAQPGVALMMQRRQEFWCLIFTRRSRLSGVGAGDVSGGGIRRGIRSEGGTR